MTDRFEIKAQEHGIVRLFTVNKDAEPPIMSVEKDWDADPVDPPWPLRDALGVEYLDSDFIELFDVSDLEGVGLPQYMIDGLGVAEAEVEQDRARLEAIRGMVLVVLSSAFGGFAGTLTPKSPLRWVGTYTEDRAPVSFQPLHSEAATAPNTAPENEAEDAPRQKNTAGIAVAVLLGLTLIGFLLLVWARF
jgi:hypothetical protein